MYQYTVIQWIFFFYLYCFLGWCFESTYVSLKSRHLVNRGFMRGPFLPLYGSGAVMMLAASMPFQDSLILVYVAGCIGATILEYVTGVVMEALFKVRYWDYSQNKFNFQGHICLGSSLAWGFLTILMTRFIHKPIEIFVLSIPGGVLMAAVYVLTAYIGADFALSFKAALDLKDILVRMEKAKEELVHVQKRLEAMVSAAEEDISDYRESINQRREEFADSLSTRMEDLRTGIEDRLEHLRIMSQTDRGRYSDKFREELQELKAKYTKSVEERKRLGSVRDFFQRNLIRSNPTMSSRRFKEALEELKKNSKNNRKHET